MSRRTIYIMVALTTFIIGIASYGYFHFRSGLSNCVVELPPSTKEELEETARITAEQNSIEDNIAEAVLRYQFQQHQEIKVFFLSRGNGSNPMNPSDKFMARFKGRAPVIKKVTQAFRSAYEVKDKETGERGIILDVYRINWLVTDSDNWLNTTDFEVSASWSATGLHKEQDKFRVVRENGRFVVSSIP